MKGKRRTHGLQTISAFALVLAVTAMLSAVPAYGDEKPAADPDGAPAEKTEEKTVITIENAQSTEYRKNKETGDDNIVLSGDVVISVTKGSTKTTIHADTIRYDRVTQMMYADGNVSMEQSGSSSGNDNATASSLLFNTSTLEGVFDGGRVVQTKTDSLNLPSGSTLIVASDIFGRSKSNTIAFKDGRLTFCDDPDPHWHIDATRIWLLPGGEFAFFNALLFVGVVPVMYLPAFYYPKDEVVFNPVFGYDRRSGYFVNTTAYLYGRKPLDTTTTTSTTSSSSTDSTSTESSGSENLKALFNFMKPTVLKKQKLEGIVLHNLDEDYTGSTSNYFKILGDWYSNLGAMAGVSGVFKPNDYITDVELLAEFGFSNTVFLDSSSGQYYPYASSGKKYQDSSDFLGMKFPFRYGLNAKFTLSKPFSFSMSLPLYSDPYFSGDFSTRSETMDWISYLMKSISTDTDTYTATEVSSFTWSVSASYTLPVPEVLKPYISAFSFSLNSSLIFSDMTNGAVTSTDALSTYSPERKFYYPSQITPLTASVSWSGSLVKITSPASASSAAKTQTPSFPVAPVVPDELKTEKEKEAERLAAEKEKADKDSQGKDKPADAAVAADKPAQDDALKTETALPEIAASSDQVQTISGFNYDLSYSIKPSVTSQIAYSSTPLSEPEDFDWKRLKSSMYTVKLPASVTSTASYGGSFLSMSNVLNFDPVFQDHPYISTVTAEGGYSESSADSLKVADYTATKRDLTNTNSVTLNPFAYIDTFKNTGLKYSNTIKIVRTKFTGTADDPEWDYLNADWSDSDSITTHQFDFTFAAQEGKSDEYSQTLVLSTTLPPQVDKYYGTLTLKFPFTSFSVETGYERTSSTDPTWKKDPFRQTLSLSFFKTNPLTFTESYSYNLQDSHHDSFKLALSWAGLQAAYTMSYTTGYDFDANSGWQARSSEDFLPYSLSFSYAPASKTLYTWKNRVSLLPGLSTSIVADLLRPTNSYFLFTPSITFKISDFLTLTFSSTSKNSVIYRYFQKAFGNDGLVPGEQNIYKDLFDSFRFDNEALRRASGFKLKSLNFSLTHDLHDWDFTTTFKVEPRLVTPASGSKYYDFSPYITIGVLWRPMSSMKTQIVDKYGTWELNP